MKDLKASLQAIRQLDTAIDFNNNKVAEHTAARDKCIDSRLEERNAILHWFRDTHGIDLFSLTSFEINKMIAAMCVAVGVE